MVHINHGIGIYRGLIQQGVAGAEREYLLIEYASGDKLFVPTDQFDRVQKYLGSEEQPPTVNRMGGADWERTKKQAKKSAEKLAGELVKLYKARREQPGHAFGPDTPWQHEMEDGFLYEETPDQLEAIQEVKGDMERPQPMDRLVCGDVGYGKTEVAIRAAFKAVMDGKQVVVLAPTTVLAQQHFTTFRERMAPYPVKVELLSRFRSKKDQDRVVADLAAGAVDIVIGTHRVLSKDVHLQGPRTARGGRGAALRREAQGAPQAASHPGGRADPHRDADSAHAAHGPERDPRYERDERPAARGVCPWRPARWSATTA